MSEFFIQFRFESPMTQEYILNTKYTRNPLMQLNADRPNLDRQVFELVKEMILKRELEPGEKIRQEKLALKIGVSRTPLINALKLLEQDRLVTAVPRRGYYVRELDESEIVPIFELREVLEGLAARKVAQGAKRLRSRFKKFFPEDSDYTGEEGFKKYAEEDRRFHSLLLSIAGEGCYSTFLPIENVLCFSYLISRDEGLLRSPQDTLKEHKNIVKAICDGEPEAAEKAVKLHVSRSILAFKERLKQEESD